MGEFWVPYNMQRFKQILCEPQMKRGLRLTLEMKRVANLGQESRCLQPVSGSFQKSFYSSPIEKCAPWICPRVRGILECNCIKGRSCALYMYALYNARHGFPSFCMIVANQSPFTVQAAVEEGPFRAKPGLFPLATQVRGSHTASCPESDSCALLPTIAPGHAHTSPSPAVGLLKGPWGPSVTWQPRTCELGQPGVLPCVLGLAGSRCILMLPYYSSLPQLRQENRADCFPSRFPRDNRSSD